MRYQPYGLVSPQRPLYPQVQYPSSIPQQRQVQYSMTNQVYHQPSIVRSSQQTYPPQYLMQNQFAPVNYGQSPIKPQSALQQSYQFNQQNPRYPNQPPQVFRQQQQPVVKPNVPQQQIPTQPRGITQQNYQPQQQIFSKQQPQMHSQNKVAPPPKQSSQQLLPNQIKPQSPPSQHRPQSQQQQNQQVPQQQINKPPVQQKQIQSSQKDDDLEKKFQDAIDKTRDLVQKYQNPQQKQPQQQQKQQQSNQQPIFEQPQNPQENDDQLQELALQYEDGYIYRGQGFEPAIREGYGILTDQNENKVYDGQWKANQYHGEGKLINIQAESIDGPFDYQDLSVIENGWLEYEGEFSEGKMNGFGRLQLTNGEVYKGQFYDGMIHGEGVFEDTNTQIIKGYWKEGILTQVFA